MRMKLIAVTIAALFVASATSSAWADLTKANSVADTFSGTALLNNNQVPVTANGASINNLFAYDVTLNAGGIAGSTQIVTATYTPGSTGGEVSFFLYTGALTSGITLTQLDFYKAADGYNPSTNVGKHATLVTGLALAPGKLDLRLGWPALTLSGGMTQPELAGYDSVRMTFTFATPGTSRLQVDYVANPEPGTIALFALGMAGMFAFAWRRRSAAKLAAVKSAS